MIQIESIGHCRFRLHADEGLIKGRVNVAEIEPFAENQLHLLGLALDPVMAQAVRVSLEAGKSVVKKLLA